MLFKVGEVLTSHFAWDQWESQDRQQILIFLLLLIKLPYVKGQISEKTSCSQSNRTDDALFSYRFIPLQQERRNPASAFATIPSLHEILERT